ncbi:GxGYxYP family putative glycoside hydrolase [Saccharibacillus sp. CPCC 101409]|uniref:GxGYxYP domain-containing protein n=1 Tax=Saccharibacillus sp. CPCC 101409 TaxID=3058041 RepID=UPI0026724C29|nr:GxGYxYP domain-containing protein [Saccharibacillus sp. CPCC 101409]MDO3413369.1 GxGYxYP family putative glycoside hydrolase [Saccharibacillus sp. CPCC 101409]
MNMKRSSKRKWPAAFAAVVLLTALVPQAGISKAQAAGLDWPSGQLLPSFSTPASTLDVMDVVTEYNYNATSSQIQHATGHLDGDGWLAQTSIDASNKHMVYGPYATDIPAGKHRAYFDMIIDNNTADNNVMVTIDVRDNTTGAILATRDVRRQDWTYTSNYERFHLDFTNPTAGHELEFRVFWHGASYIKVRGIGTESLDRAEEAVVLTSLKGIVNREQPRIYSYDNPVKGEEGKYNWLNSLGLGHADVADNWSLLTKYRSEVDGIVVYDDNVPDTVNLATTIASQEDAIVAPPSLVSKLTAAPYNFPIIEDLRGEYANKLAVYQDLYDNYWPDLPHNVIVGLNPDLKGFLRDYATAIGTATIWLNPAVPAEKALLQDFFSDMPYGSGIYMGWWPEEQLGVQTASQYGISTIASDFSSNLTVFGGTSRQIDVKPVPAKPALDDKIYISLILSDGDNLQYMEHRFKKIWDSANRGEVPLGWTVSPAMLDAMPGVLDYLYDTATPNDALISGPSGVGYTYPNYWTNQNYLDDFTALSGDYLERAGLRVVTIWNTITGSTNQNVGESFAQNAPNLLGLTAQGGGNGNINVFDGTLPNQVLNANYCYSYATLELEINNAIAGWDGTSPRFVSIQANPWDVDYQDFVDVVDHFSSNSNIVFVRPDNYFQLMREDLGLPIDPATTTTTQP